MSQSTDKTLDQREADHAIKNYTRVANMLVDGYTQLHPQDKWLFVCLDRLCGRNKTRHLSLRYISKKTGFSPSVLSDNKKNSKPGMIRRLHDAGLIHAEIKRKKQEDGEEEKQAQYHITITDTWALNYAFYNDSAKCSESEQSEDDNTKSVLIQNESVPNQNANDKKRSDSERECSDSGTIVRLQDKITNSSKITYQEENSDDLHSQDRTLSLSPEEIELILSLRAQNASSVPHHGSEQTQPTIVASAHNTPPFADTPLQSGGTVPRSGDSTSHSSGEVSPTPVSSNSATKDAALPSAQQSETTTSTSPKTASQRENELSTLHSTEASSLRIADTLPDTTQEPSSRQKTPRKTAEKPARTVITLSPEAQAVYDEWCKLPWYKVPPDITPTLAEHCEKAKAYTPTVDVMLKVKNWATSKENDRNGYYKGKGWNMKFFLNELPKWLAVNDLQQSQQAASSSQTTTKARMTHDEACKLAHDIAEQGKKHGYTIQAQATTSKKDQNVWVIHVKWENAERLANPVIKSPEHWQAEFNEVHEALTFVPLSMKREAR